MDDSRINRKLALRRLNKRNRLFSESDDNESSSNNSKNESEMTVANVQDDSEIKNLEPLLDSDNINVPAVDLASTQPCNEEMQSNTPAFFSDNSDSDFSEDESAGFYDSSSDSELYSSEKSTKVQHDKNNPLYLAIREKLRYWATKFCLVQRLVTSLLVILKPIFPCLPKDAKNLLKTENKFTIESFGPENK